MSEWLDQDELIQCLIAREWIPPGRKLRGRMVWRRSEVVGDDERLEGITDAVRRQVEK